MDETRTYPLADILTITTGLLLSHRHMDGVDDIADWMTGDSLMTHQLPRAAALCGPALIVQHPSLTGVAPPPDLNEPNLRAWLRDAEREHGEELPVTPLQPGVWVRQDPIAELIQLRANPAAPAGEQPHA